MRKQATGRSRFSMFVYEPALLMIGAEWYVILQAFVSASIGTTCLAGSLAGYFIGPATRAQRVMLFAAALLLIKPGWITDLIGLALLAAGVGAQVSARRGQTTPSPRLD